MIYTLITDIPFNRLSYTLLQLKIWYLYRNNILLHNYRRATITFATLLPLSWYSTRKFAMCCWFFFFFRLIFFSKYQNPEVGFQWFSMIAIQFYFKIFILTFIKWHFNNEKSLLNQFVILDYPLSVMDHFDPRGYIRKKWKSSSHVTISFVLL